MSLRSWLFIVGRTSRKHRSLKLPLVVEQIENGCLTVANMLPVLSGGRSMKSTSDLGRRVPEEQPIPEGDVPGISIGTFTGFHFRSSRGAGWASGRQSGLFVSGLPEHRLAVDAHPCRVLGPTTCKPYSRWVIQQPAIMLAISSAISRAIILVTSPLLHG